METTVPRKVVVAVAFILVALCGLGIYQGWRRGGAGEQEGEGGLPSVSTPSVAGAKTASALTDPLTPTLTEAQVREIARQEARSAMGKPAVAAASEGDEDSSPAPARPASAPAATATATPARSAPDRPALQTPVAPVPTQPDGGQAPLF